MTQGPPFLEWDDKYKKKSKGMKDDVAVLGGQILHVSLSLWCNLSDGCKNHNNN